MNPNTLPRKQSGAVLLAFILVLIAGTSYLLLNRLNNYTSNARNTETQMALLEAKKALLSYAMNYPELRAPTVKGPGFLPCPDQNNDAVANNMDNCGSSVTTTMRLGRLPSFTLGLTDIRDSSGERLWYAVSDNFKNTLSNGTVLNSETPGLITVDVVNDIVAVIVAPGGPVGAQSARPSNVPADYLEDVNAIASTGTFVTTSAGEFNDRLITITREELMAVVEQRVINEIRAVLTAYYNENGAYPWMTAFADPKADSRRLTGYAGAASGGLTLDDNTQDFLAWGVVAGDIIYNITDGSRGVVSSVNDPTSITVSSLLYGTNNVFNDDDRYAVIVNSSTSTFSGTAKIGSSGITLVDNTKDFKDIGVAPGDVIENLGVNISSGMVESVSANEITLKSLKFSDGTDDVFSSGDLYQIRSNAGTVTTADDAVADGILTLIDANKDFTIMGIHAGDLIANLSDDSFGTISAVSANTLTVNSLQFGTDNNFDAGDYYYLPRYNTDSNTRTGLLSFHEEGELFPTAFDIDFNIAAAGGDIVFDTASFPAYQAPYKSAMENYISNYVSSNSFSLTLAEGKCNWIVPDVADCFAGFDDYVNISGSDTASVNSQTQITDSTAQFITDGVKRGDLAHNFDDEVSVTTGTADALVIGTATGNSSNLTLEDTSKNFIALGISVGDNIANTTDGSSGVVASVTTNNITVTSLSGGTDNVFAEFDNYEIWRHSELYDASMNFISTGIEPYSFVIQNNTLEAELGQPKIQAIISEVIDANTLAVANYTGEGDTPTPTTIMFRPGDTYEILAPRKDMVVRTDPTVNTTVSISKLSAANPDFDAGEYYRIIPAASSTSGTVDSTSPVTCTLSNICTIIDLDADFVTRGVEIGDTIENTSDMPNSSFGIITNVTATTVTTRLYGGVLNLFLPTHNYTIYHDYVHSRRHEIHVRFSGNMKPKSLSSDTGNATGGSSNLLLEDTGKDFINLGVLVGDTVTNTTDGSSGIIESRTNTTITVTSLIDGTNNVFNPGDNYTITGSFKRLRDVCLGYDPDPYPNTDPDTDCIDITSPATAFSGYGGVPLITIRDYEVNGTTVVGRATFTPSSSSTGSIRVANIDYYLSDNDDIPGWFIKNKWHQFIYVAYSADYIPGGANDCVTSGNCLTLQVQRPSGPQIYNNREALVMAAGMQLPGRDRSDASLGILNYFENANADNDLVFEKRDITDSFNDQISVIAP